MAAISITARVISLASYAKHYADDLMQYAHRRRCQRRRARSASASLIQLHGRSRKKRHAARRTRLIVKVGLAKYRLPLYEGDDDIRRDDALVMPKRLKRESDLPGFSSFEVQ